MAADIPKFCVLGGGRKLKPFSWGDETPKRSQRIDPAWRHRELGVGKAAAKTASSRTDHSSGGCRRNGV